ncbi:hypothetical protein [Nonomuraea sp. CA-141351]|uniref:hypothetical protein n=1 Tax=Nonomuraea sp. CA-141351 TaxID=3239996 RepID=UPI003D8A3A95
MSELVQLEPVGVVGEQDAGAVVAQPDPAGLRTDVVRVGGGQAVRAGTRTGTAGRVPGRRSAGAAGARIGSGLDVEPADISTLAEVGHLAVADVFEKKGRSYDLYALADIDALTPGQVRPVIEKRPRGWTGRCPSTKPRNRWAGTTASQPGVPSRSLRRARCWSCRSCTPGTQ